MVDIQFYQAEFTGDGHVGGNITSTTVSSLLSDSIIAPPHGVGPAWTYDKYYLNLTGGGTAQNVGIYLSAATHPEQILFANTNYFNDLMTGNRTVYGDQSDIEFYCNGTEVDRPVFVHAHGSVNALTLYNQSGELGGQIAAEAGTGNAMAFWVARKLDEHTISGNTYFSFAITYG